MNPLAVSGTRRQMKELVDGTIRVQVDIDPDCRAAFLALFPDIDTRVAIAPLRSEAKIEKAKGGELARLAGMLCADTRFQTWLGQRASFEDLPSATEAMGVDPVEHTAIIVRNICGINSRAELDNDIRAAAIFRESIYNPYNEFRA